MPDAPHVLLTRFNLPLDSFTADRDGQPTRSDAWLEHRLRLFRDVCVPSIAAQRCRDFRWFLLIDTVGAAALRARLAPMLRGIDAVMLESATAGGWRKALREALSPLPPHLIVTRFDNDDALHPDFTAHAQAMLLPHAAGQATFPPPPMVLNFSLGLCWDGDRFHHRVVQQNAFGTWLVQRREGTVAGFAALPFDMNHAKVAERYPVIDLRLREPMWVQVIHDRNAMNAVRGTPLDALSPEAEAAFGYLRGVAL